MPLYVYECPSCGRQVELIQKINENGESKVSCALPGCVGRDSEMRRVIAPSNFILKGGGWAKDGYSGGGKK